MTHLRAGVRKWLVPFMLAITVAAPMNFVVGAIHRYFEQYAIWSSSSSASLAWSSHVIGEMVGGFAKDYGWPTRATRIEFSRFDEQPAITAGTFAGGIAVPNVGVGGQPLYIAVLPIFPGFLINTALYAAALLAMFTACSNLRRRANTCRRCAYPLTGLPPNSPCPECGEELQTG